MLSVQYNNSWLQFHPSKALIFDDTETVWKSLKESYNGTFRNLVFGNFPKDKEILRTLLMIRDRLSMVAWEVNFEKQTN